MIDRPFCSICEQDIHQNEGLCYEGKWYHDWCLPDQLFDDYREYDDHHYWDRKFKERNEKC